MSLSFIAVAMIVVHHSRGVLWLTPDFLRHFALDQAVLFFFVLSGFILTYVCLSKVERAIIRKEVLYRYICTHLAKPLCHVLNPVRNIPALVL